LKLGHKYETKAKNRIVGKIPALQRLEIDRQLDKLWIYIVLTNYSTKSSADFRYIIKIIFKKPALLQRHKDARMKFAIHTHEQRVEQCGFF
jgi:hypothetical protein